MILPELFFWTIWLKISENHVSVSCTNVIKKMNHYLISML